MSTEVWTLVQFKDYKSGSYKVKKQAIVNTTKLSKLIAQAKAGAFCQEVFRLFSLKITPEFRFHPTRHWRFDYAIPGIKFAIEVEGGVWTGGRHTRGKGFIGDMEKYNQAALLGWTLYRTTPDKLFSEETFNAIKKLIQNEQKY